MCKEVFLKNNIFYNNQRKNKQKNEEVILNTMGFFLSQLLIPSFSWSFFFLFAQVFGLNGLAEIPLE